MAELLLINPAKRRTRRKGRTAAQKAATRRMISANRGGARKRRKNPISAVKSSMRRRVVRSANPARRIRRRRNPISMRSLNTSGIVKMMTNAAIGGAGAVGMDFVMDQVNKYLPDSLKPNAANTKIIDTNDMVRIALTVLLGRGLSKMTRGKSEVAAMGALTVQMAEMGRMLADPTQAAAGVGYSVPAAVSRGTARISPITRMSGVGMFQPAGGKTPLLSGVGAFNRPGGRSPLLSASNRMMQREGIRYR